MRLEVLNRGHKLRHKMLFKMIRVVSGHPAPDVVKLLMYRGDYFGTPINEVFQETMRGPFGVGDRRARDDGVVHLEDQRMRVLNTRTRRGRVGRAR